MTITLDAPADVAGPTASASPAPGASRSRALALLVVVAIGATAYLHREAVAAAFDQLTSAQPEWIALTLLATVSGWVAGTACQVGSLPVTPPLGPLLAVQVAATAANNAVPGGVGGMVVNLRFLRRHGVYTPTAAAAFALNSASGAVAHLLLLGGAAVLFPQPTAAVFSAVPIGASLLVTTAVLALALLACSRRTAFGWTALARAVDPMRSQRSVLQAICLDPRRAAALWVGSFAIPLLHAAALYGAARAIGLAPDPGNLVVAYLIAAAVSSLVPSPGGVGAFDVLLPAALVATGLTLESAVATAVAYRLVTVWLPLLPAGALLAFLVRRRIV